MTRTRRTPTTRPGYDGVSCRACTDAGPSPSSGVLLPPRVGCGGAALRSSGRDADRRRRRRRGRLRARPDRQVARPRVRRRAPSSRSSRRSGAANPRRSRAPSGRERVGGRAPEEVVERPGSRPAPWRRSRWPEVSDRRSSRIALSGTTGRLDRRGVGRGTWWAGPRRELVRLTRGDASMDVVSDSPRSGGSPSRTERRDAGDREDLDERRARRLGRREDPRRRRTGSTTAPACSRASAATTPRSGPAVFRLNDHLVRLHELGAAALHGSPVLGRGAPPRRTS